MLILGILAFGMLVGWLGQLVLGMDRRPNARSLAAGLLGSLVGGTLGSLLTDEGFRLQPAGLIGSFVGAVVVLLIWQQVDKRDDRDDRS
ncbi:MAG: GlsB/YeaQ/YmgE family stress response membrane protein [Microthrixaceae bacterium]